MTTETQSAFAERHGWSRSYVTQLKADGRLVLADNGLVDVEASLQRIKDTEDPSKAAVAARHAEQRAAQTDNQEPEDASQPSFKLFQARKMKADAEMAERANKRDAGLVVPRDVVLFAIDDIVAGVRSRLENWPDRLAPELYPLQTLEETRAHLVEAVEIELRAMADKVARRAMEMRGQGNA